MQINTESRPPFSQRTVLALPFISCAAVFILTLLAIKLIWVLGPWSLDGARPTDWSAVGIALAASLGFMAALVILMKTDILSMQRLLQISFLVLLLCAVANLIWRFTDLNAYGDSKHFTKYLRNNHVFPRWFLGTALLTRVYHYLWAALGTHLPKILSTPDGCIRLTGAVVMAASSLVFLRIHGNRLALLVPLLSPIWLMFCTAYNEYYPFIAFVYLGFLFVLQSDELARRSPLFVAVISSVLCLSYTAFLPLGLLLIACYGFSSGLKKALVALLVTALLCFGAIVLLWPETLEAFALEYHDALNLGEKNTHYPAYIGRSSGDATPFFTLSYAFSAEHLLHLCYMFFFSAGLVPPVLFVLALYGIWKKGFLARLIRAKAVLFLGSCLAFQLCYFVLMIPKRGPINDIDLFFSLYLTVGFTAGFLADRLLDTIPVETRDTWKNCIIGACIGNGAVILLHLLLLGIIPS